MTGTLPVPAVPASQAAADDWHELAFHVTTSEGSRSASLMFRAAGDRSTPLAPVLAQPTVSAASAAPHGPRVQLAMQPEYDQAIDARFGHEGGYIILYATARSLGSPSTWDLTMPDLTGVEGWQEAWNPPATAWQDWQLLAFGGTWPWFGPPADGAVYRSASRRAGGSGAFGLAPRRPHILTSP
jgi:hypothetical protein